MSRHYQQHLSEVECIELSEEFDFCIGNAIKYIWRAGHKTVDARPDLEKAEWYLLRADRSKNQRLPAHKAERLSAYLAYDFDGWRRMAIYSVCTGDIQEALEVIRELME